MINISSSNEIYYGKNSSTRHYYSGYQEIQGYRTWYENSTYYYGGLVFKNAPSGNEWISFRTYSGTVNWNLVSLYTPYNLLAAGLICRNSSAFLKKNIEKLEYKNLKNIDEFFNYNIFKY